MGLVLPIYPIVVQNAVSQAEVGAVTGFSTFFRSIGGTVGVAAFGSMMLASYRKQLVSPLLSKEVLSAVENPLEPSKLHAHLAQLLPNAKDAEAVTESQACAGQLDRRRFRDLRRGAFSNTDIDYRFGRITASLGRGVRRSLRNSLTNEKASVRPQMYRGLPSSHQCLQHAPDKEPAWPRFLLPQKRLNP